MTDMEPLAILGITVIVVGLLATIFYKPLFKKFQKKWSEDSGRGSRFALENNTPQHLLFGTVGFMVVGIVMVLSSTQ